MKIKVLMFGIAKEITGSNAIEIEVSDTLRIYDLRTLLEKQYPALKKLSSFMLALNNEYATGEETLQAHDEIALIPPVSGG